MSDQANSGKPQNQIIYFFRACQLYLFARLAKQRRITMPRFGCLECDGSILTFSADPLEYTEALTEKEDHLGGFQTGFQTECFVENI